MAVSGATTEGRPSALVAHDASFPRRGAFTLAVLAAYVLLAVIAFWRLFPAMSQQIYGLGADSILGMWFLAWVPHALAHGQNPLFSGSIFVPAGVNLAQNTEAPLLGLITAPFAVVLGPVARANLLMVLAMPASATAAFLVLRRWRVWDPAAALGGLIYGFSPFAVAHSLGHPVLVFLPLPPLIAMTVVSILQGRGRPRRLGIGLGLLITAQFLIEPEVLTTVAILTAWAVACAALRYPAKVGDVARASVRPVGIALGLAAVLLAYPIWMMLAGPQHYTGTAQPIVNPYYNDLFSFIDPGSLQRFTFGLPALKATAAGPVQAGGYFGIPLLILAALFAWRSRRSPRMQLTVAVLVGSVVLSLGPHLAIDGRLTHIPLPFLVLTHLPLLDNILPVRLSIEIAACVAAFDRVRARRRPSGAGTCPPARLIGAEDGRLPRRGDTRGGRRHTVADMAVPGAGCPTASGAGGQCVAVG